MRTINHDTVIGGPGHYYVFFTGNKDDSGISVVSRMKITDHGDDMYGTWVHIIDGYTTATARTFAKIVGIASGRDVSEIVGARDENGKTTFIAAEF